MDIKVKTALLLMPILLNSCATATQSTLLGAAVGGTAGGLLGQAQTANSEGTLVGAAIGVGLGGLIGLLSHKEKKAEQNKIESTSKDLDEFPALTRPKLRSIWVPDAIEGNKYIKGHYIYVIENPGTWTKD
ncbi:MAG: glycine zipper 2TM domain-containing protein [Oligoflexia bacterium]|nr:glycine zipper 2TM domain-containing protein [Oligoflexia bacterium]